MMVCGSPPSQSPAASMVVTPTPTTGSDVDPELHTFREAIALSGMLISFKMLQNIPPAESLLVRM